MKPFISEIPTPAKNLADMLKESELGKRAEKPQRDVEIELNLPIWLGGGGVHYRNEIHNTR